MRHLRQRLLSTTLLVGLAHAAPLYAQAQSQAGNLPADTQEPVVDAKRQLAESSPSIVITGTRIPQPNLTSAAPITVVTSEDIKLTGTDRIEDVLNQLPSVTANQSGGISNGATGTAEVDLRNLGPRRTLVLVNGRRVAPGDPNDIQQAPDLNLIPASLIKRVDVLTGAASSVYGADAVAGVVNFIMDTDFTGVRFDTNYSFYQHNNDCPSLAGNENVCDVLGDRQRQGLTGFNFPRGSVSDGGTFDGTVSVGASFDDKRGHAMAYFGYRKVNAVTQDQRDFSACGLTGTGTTESKGSAKLRCGGSATSAQGNALVFVPNPDNPGFGTSTFFTFGPNRSLVGGETLFNFNPLNYFQRPDERYTAGAFADYEVSKAFHPYMEFMFMDDHTLAQIAPSGDFGNTFTINCDNPFMSAQAQGVVCSPGNTINGFLGTAPLPQSAPYNPNPGAPATIFTDARGNQFTEGYFNLLRRNVEGGARVSDLTHTQWRGVLGSRGELSRAWSYDAYFQYGRTDYEQVFRNDLSAKRLQNALNVVNVDANGRTVNPATGQAYALGAPGTTLECRSVLDGSDPACVPYDIFGTPSSAAVNYLNVFGVVTGQTSEQIADANLTGELGEMGVQTPWSDEGVAVNVGTEYRRESLTLNPDQEFQTGDLTGQGAPTLPVNGAFRVLETFGEVQIPIVRHSFFDELSISAGYRRSWYKTLPGEANGSAVQGRTFNTDTYKVALEFAPVHDILLRGAFNRAVRAPNIEELFSQQFVALDGTVDPCAGHAIQASETGCLAQGLHVGQNTPTNPAAQYNGKIGGNPDLNPEKATTKTLGVVLQPRFVPHLAITADWYDIKIKGAIQGFGEDAILNNCVNESTATSTAASCALVHRNAAGSLWLSPDGFVTDLPQNVGSVETRGIDASVSYSHRLSGVGTVSLGFNGTYLDSYKINDGLNPTYECAGFYGNTCLSVLPRWRHKARVSLNTPSGFGLSTEWRMIGAVSHEANSKDVVLNGTPPQLSNHIGAQSYIDLAATYDLGKRYDFRVGVNNVFDKTPPLITNSSGACAGVLCNGNTYPGVYDVLGRFIYAGATVNF